LLKFVTSSELQTSFLTAKWQETDEIEAKIEHIDVEIEIDDEPETFYVAKGSSSRGAGLLVSSLGYSLGRNGSRNGCTYWRCAVRSKGRTCNDSVVQSPEGGFQAGKRHTCDPDVDKTLQVEQRVKDAAKSSIFTPATAIAEREVTKEADNFLLRAPNMENVSRNANRFREKGRPKHPSDLSFDLHLDALPPGFLTADICMPDTDCRHLVFALPDDGFSTAHSK
jgi:hypothetical protein